jgi:hypothetical protein
MKPEAGKTRQWGIIIGSKCVMVDSVSLGGTKITVRDSLQVILLGVEINWSARLTGANSGTSQVSVSREGVVPSGMAAVPTLRSCLMFAQLTMRLGFASSLYCPLLPLLPSLLFSQLSNDYLLSHPHHPLHHNSASTMDSID